MDVLLQNSFTCVYSILIPLHIHLFCSEIQLKSPNWLFGQRKFEESNPALKAASQETVNGRSQDEKRVDDLYDFNWLSSSGDDIDEEDVFKRYFSSKSLSLSLTSMESKKGKSIISQGTLLDHRIVKFGNIFESLLVCVCVCVLIWHVAKLILYNYSRC